MSSNNSNFLNQNSLQSNNDMFFYDKENFQNQNSFKNNYQNQYNQSQNNNQNEINLNKTIPPSNDSYINNPYKNSNDNQKYRNETETNYSYIQNGNQFDQNSHNQSVYSYPQNVQYSQDSVPYYNNNIQQDQINTGYYSPNFIDSPLKGPQVIKRASTIQQLNNEFEFDGNVRKYYLKYANNNSDLIPMNYRRKIDFFNKMNLIVSVGCCFGMIMTYVNYVPENMILAKKCFLFNFLLISATTYYSKVFIKQYQIQSYNELISKYSEDKIKEMVDKTIMINRTL